MIRQSIRPSKWRHDYSQSLKGISTTKYLIPAHGKGAQQVLVIFHAKAPSIEMERWWPLARYEGGVGSSSRLSDRQPKYWMNMRLPPPSWNGGKLPLDETTWLDEKPPCFLAPYSLILYTLTKLYLLDYILALHLYFRKRRRLVNKLPLFILYFATAPS